MATATRERKYALSRIQTGDYILLSNDLRQVWRICRGTELFAEETGEKERDGWELWRWRGGGFDRLGEVGFAHEFDRDEWEHCGFSWTRAEAVDDALRMGET